MLSKQEKENHAEILQALKVAVDVMDAKLLDIELRQMATRLLRFYGKPLFDIITKIPQGNYFPPCHAIENDARRALGLPPVGLTADLIEKNESELVVGGQPLERAKAGAAMMRSTLRRAERDKDAPTVLSPGGAIVRVATMREVTLGPAAVGVQPIDLGGFDDEEEKVETHWTPIEF